MKRVFLVLALMFGCAIGTLGQTVPTVNVPVLDPANFTLFNTKALSTMPFNLIVNVPLGMTWLSATLSPTGNADGFTVTAECVADSTYPETQSINISLSQAVWIEYFQNIVTAGATVKNGFSPQTVATAAGSPNAIHFGVSGCAKLYLQFSSPTGTTTDTLRAQGQFNSFPMLPFGMGGPPQSLCLGSNQGTLMPCAVSGTGTFIVAQNTAPTDGEANSASTLPAVGAAGTPLEVFPKFFNGATWDRQFYCNKTTFQTVVATTTQIVAGVAAQKIRVCTVVIERNDVTGVATTLKLVEGTGASCGTGQTALTGNLFTSGTTAVTADSPPAVITMTNTGAFITNVAADALCVQTTGAASSFDVTITFEQH